MDILKTKDAADLLSVSQTTIKRWASHFPDYFPKDRSGHYIFSEQEINLLIHIKDRIDHGDPLDRIDLVTNKQSSVPLQEDKSPLHTPDKSIKDMVTRLDYIERSLQQKADDIVSVQLLKQREELEDIRQMIAQLAAAIETIQKPSSNPYSSREEIHPVAAARLQSPPKKRSLLRTFFSFL
jgi:chromosome-anchoring protein RacA